VAALSDAQSRSHDVAVFAPSAGRPEDRGRVRTFAFRQGGGTSFLERTRFPPAEAAFREALAAFRPDVVHVHHLAGLSAGILGIAAEAGARVVLTVHDHALACPRGQRIRLDLDPCPVLDRERCVRCVRPSWIEAVRAPDRLRALAGLFRPGEGRRLFADRDAHLAANLDRVAAFIAPSRSAADLFCEFHPAARARTTVVPHGMEIPAAVAPPPPAGRPFTVGFFGTLLPSKGVFVLAEAAARLAAEDITVAFHGGGAPEVAAEVRRRSGGAAVLAGPYGPRELSGRMSGVHAVAVPSLWPETFSIVVREAWAHGRPVLASDTGALAEAAGPRRDRVGLVPAGDVAAWAAAIRRLARDPAWSAELAAGRTPEPFDAMLDAIMACYMVRP
jgi:glycosyltransferase involved in cell wall biosynthesis